MMTGTLLSRRGLFVAMAAFCVSVLLGVSAEATRRAPRIVGDWQGTIQLGEDTLPFELDVTKQKKNGQFNATLRTPIGNARIKKGKIKRNGRITGNFRTVLNGQPVDVTVNMQVSGNGQSASGTVVAKNAGGQVVAEGQISMFKQVPKG